MDRGIVPPLFKENRKTKWHQSTIIGFEANYLVYAGHLTYDRNPAKGRKADFLVAQDQHEPIIDEQLGQTVYENSAPAQKRNARGRSKGGHGYALSGILFCANPECACRYHGDRGQYNPADRHPGCPHQGVSQKRIEGFLLEVLQEHVLPFFDPDTAHRIWRREVQKSLPRATSRKRLEAELSKARGQLQRLVEAVAQGTLEPDDVRSTRDELRARETALMQSLATEGVQKTDFENISKSVKGLFEDLKGAFDRADLGAQQRLFRTFFDRVEIGPTMKETGRGGEERRKVILHTLFPLPNTVLLASPTGFEPVLPD